VQLDDVLVAGGLPGVREAGARGVEREDILVGQGVYRASCAVCHGPSGEGLPLLGKPVRNSAYVQQASDEELFSLLADGRKLGFLSPHLIPVVAICDPTLTLDLPAHLTAGTGMDALTHCVETYIATAYNPPADGIALDGLKRAAANLERAVEKGCDLVARREMMAAAMNGALAFQKGLGGVHAMSHALGGITGYRLHHGTLNAVLLPHVLEFNAPAVSHRYGDLKQAMGLPANADLPAEIEGLTRRIGLPVKLGDMGVDEPAIECAAPLAEKDHTNGTNPRRAGAEDYHKLMHAAL